nr:hypothetical protein [Tanacetum cinerariifolium]
STPTTTVVAAPRLYAAAKGKQPARARSLTEPLDIERTEAEQLNIEDQGLRIGEEERMHEEEEADELYRDVHINQGRGLQVSQVIKDSHVTLTPTHSDGQQETSQIPIPPTSILSLDLQNLLTFASVFCFKDRVKLLEVHFSNIPDRLQDSIQRENDEFLKTIDDNMKKIIKEQVKTQVKAQVKRILPRIEESMNAQLEAEVLTRSSHSLRTSYAVAADLSEMELKKILIDKMEGNKSIQRSDKQRNLYKALVEAYDADKTILDTYGESTILKRRHEEDDDQEGPSAGSDRGEDMRKTMIRKDPPLDQTGGLRDEENEGSIHQPVLHLNQLPGVQAGAEDQLIVQTSQHPEWFSHPRRPPTPDRNWNKTLPAAQGNA